MASNTVRLSFTVDSAQARRELGKVRGSLQDVERQGTRSSGRLHKALGIGLKGAAIGAGVAVGGLALALKNGYDEMAEAQRVTAQTNAVLKSTGGVANVTKKHVLDLAGALSRKSGIDDQVVQSGANMLLTFKNIRNETGKGNNVFDQSTSILADMSTALGTDMPGAAIKLGKALNDPVRGVTALTRVGVTFTDAQKDQITALVDSGKTMDAQKIILRELTSEFGGSAKAAGDTFPGQLAKLRNSFDDVTAKLTEKLLPAATRLLDFFNDLLNAPSVDVAAKIAWSGVASIAGDLWDKLVAAFKGDAPTFAAAASIRWTQVTDAAGELLSNIGDALLGSTTTEKRYSLSLHRLVTFEKHDQGLLADMGDAIGSLFDEQTATTRRYSVPLHRLIVVERTDPSLADQFTASLKDAVEHINWTDVFVGAAKGVGDGLMGLTIAFRKWEAQQGAKLDAWFGERLGAFGDWFTGINKRFQNWLTDWGRQWRQLEHLAEAPMNLLARALGGIWGGIRSNAASHWSHISHTIRGWGDDIHGAVLRKLGSIPAAVGRIWDAVRGGVDRKWQSITSTISGWVSTALRPVNAVLGFLGMDTIGGGSTPRSNPGNQQSGNPGAAVQRRAHGGYIVPPRPGGHLLQGINGAPFVAGEAGAEELVLTTDKRHKKRTVQLVHDLLNKLGEPPQYGLGGWIKDQVNNARGAVGSAVGAVGDLAGALLHPADWIKSHLPTIPTIAGGVGRMVMGVLDHVKDALVRAVTGVVGGSGGATVQRALSEARRIDALNLPYVWGGGHQSSPAPANGPFDCSGFVSHILQYAGINIPTMTSGSMMGIGSPGRGAGLEVLANPNHVYMKIGAGGYYGTSSYNPGGGPGKLPYGERSGFAIRHFEKGGFVDAPEGQAVPAVVHGGEEVVNAKQRRGLVSSVDHLRKVLNRMWSWVGSRFFPGFSQPPFALSRRSGRDEVGGYAVNGPRRHVSLNPDVVWPLMTRDLDPRYRLTRRSAASIVLHEWAHAFQNKSVLPYPKPYQRWLVEGGAEAFARSVVKPALRAIGMQPGLGSDGANSYSGYVSQVLRSKGPGWVLYDQFAHRAYHTKKTRENYLERFHPQTLRRYDRGGLVDAPLGAPVPAIVHGGETTLPTHKRGYAGIHIEGGIHVHVDGPNGESDQQFGRRIAVAIEQHLDRAGV